MGTLSSTKYHFVVCHKGGKGMWTLLGINWEKGQDLTRLASKKIELGGNKSEVKVIVVKLEEATSGSTWKGGSN
jgi:hypothetical protein